MADCARLSAHITGASPGATVPGRGQSLLVQICAFGATLARWGLSLLARRAKILPRHSPDQPDPLGQLATRCSTAPVTRNGYAISPQKNAPQSPLHSFFCKEGQLLACNQVPADARELIAPPPPPDPAYRSGGQPDSPKSPRKLPSMV